MTVKWNYISLISTRGKIEGRDYVLEMLEKYGAVNTGEITEEQAREFAIQCGFVKPKQEEYFDFL